MLGALGSGVWELIRPLFLWAYIAILNIATLGLDSLKDGVYQGASSDQHFYSILASYHLSVFLACFTAYSVVVYIRIALRPKTNFVLRAIPLTLIFVMTISMVQAVRIIYIMGLASYNEKLEVLVTPYITDSDLKKFRAEYKKIINKKQYLEHVDKLIVVLKTNGEKTPDRPFF